jgi:putative ABC transport system substrate-binding protein
MRRREFIALIGGAGAWQISGIVSPRYGNAQAPPKMLRVGTVSAQPRTTPLWVHFDQRLRELGYVEGRNLAVEFLESPQFDRYDEFMNELVRRKVDIILASGPEIALKSAIAVTKALPIVMIAIDYDPIDDGYVTSLARPTGNVTGLFFRQVELSLKRLQLLSESFPETRAATVFWDQASAEQWRATQSAAATLRFNIAGIELQDQPYDYDRALAQAPPDHRGALVTLTSGIFYRDRHRLANFTLRHRIISVFAFRDWVEAGGLMSYGPNINLLYERAADYVDRIAKGAIPADLPIEQPTKFELAINLKTAGALGLPVPPSLLARADEVIE